MGEREREREGEREEGREREKAYIYLSALEQCPLKRTQIKRDS